MARTLEKNFFPAFLVEFAFANLIQFVELVTDKDSARVLHILNVYWITFEKDILSQFYDIIPLCQFRVLMNI